ncbi:hypothetical protein JTE90_011993 [Oedothorax gibbosus]|uniref:Serine/threonine-protein kinase 11-interacting protein n=1 Tax=Oedothorax gibbosus TaxID=931172 RepID=A0AAV6UPT6_9ARAC|nr:hypothetical protein JTE90_011993 [Oedothorax gibbosus]
MSRHTLEPKYIIASRLTNYLQIHGDKVLNGSCKMSLATSALCLLNNLFVEVSNDGLAGDSSRFPGNVVQDVQFLSDFMKKIPSLKLFHQVQTLRGGVDLTIFPKLTVLELRKIPAHLIIGLDCLAVQLKALICSRSLYLLKEIFGTSLNEEREALIWTELKELNLSYNYLENLDQSLRCLPNVEVLDLSHNHIKNTEEIQVLKMLTFVNLSYNNLGSLPVFHTSSCRSLTKLYMRNNHLEDLDGLDCLFNLEELDVSYNLLSEYNVLNPLDKLKCLRMITFEGNPLFFHHQHQLLVVSYLNPLVLIRGLTLNGKPLTVNRSVPATAHNQVSQDNHHQTSINAVVGDGSEHVTSNLDYLSRSFADFSERSSFEERSSLTSQDGAEKIAVSTRKVRRRKSKTGKKKAKKLREVLINENNDDEDLEVEKNIETVPGTAIPSHLQTKATMETRRHKLGQSWLIPESSFSKIMLPAPQVPSNTPINSTILTSDRIPEKDLAEKINSSLAIQNSKSSNNVLTSSPKADQDMTEVHDVKFQEAMKDLEEMREMQDEIKTIWAGVDPDKNPDMEFFGRMAFGDEWKSQMGVASSKEDSADGDIYKLSADHSKGDYQNLEGIEELESEEENEDSIFFVERFDGSSTTAASVIVGPNYIKEKDVVSAKLLDRLDLNALQSVAVFTKEKNGIKFSEVHLQFDTLNSSRQKRIYTFDDIDSAKVLSKTLQPFADATTLKEVTLGALECLKCNSQFSKSNANKMVLKTKKPLYGKDILSSSSESRKEYVQEVDACPNCGSHILVEMETLPMPGMATSPTGPVFQKKKSDKSPDSVSAGSGSPGKLLSSFFPSLKISPILKRKSPMVTNGTENKDIEQNLNGNGEPSLPLDDNSRLRRNSSDITILSNPSQSSIAVIPDPDMNLNTILERNSQTSISPPISQDSTYYKAHISSVPEGYIDTIRQDDHNVSHHKEQIPGNRKDADFYSFTESSLNTSASHFATTEVTSSESEHFRSPAKTQGSQRSISESPIDDEELDESSHLLNLLGEKKVLSYSTFNEIDHRLKLHLEINIFGKDEQLEACLMTSIVPLSSGDEFSGLFAISSRKVYIIKFLPSFHKSLHQNEPFDKAIQIVHASLLQNISQIDVFLGSQGLTIALGASNVYSLIIRDADTCNVFSSLLSDFIQERKSICGPTEFLSSADITLQMIRETVFSKVQVDEVPEVLLHLFAFYSRSPTQEDIPVCLIVTSDNLFVSRILYKKCDAASDLKNLCAYQYSLLDDQLLSDVMSLKLKNNLKSVEVNFLNESSPDDSVVWNLRMESKSSMFSFVSALKSPWEGMFGVPLSLSCEEE